MGRFVKEPHSLTIGVKISSKVAKEKSKKWDLSVYMNSEKHFLDCLCYFKIGRQHIFSCSYDCQSKVTIM